MDGPIDVASRHLELQVAVLGLARSLDDDDTPLVRRRTKGFVACVERIRSQLRPIQSQSALEESYLREAIPHRALDTAYALRWLELAGVSVEGPWTTVPRGR